MHFDLIIAKIIFWVSSYALIHSYIIYPFITKFLARGKKLTFKCYAKEDNWPLVIVLMAVHNEEKVLAEKVESLIGQSYPKDKLKIYIGSDCSTDSTNEIGAQLARDYSNLEFIPFKERSGKPGLINKIEEISSTNYPRAKDKIYLLTDANIILHEDALSNMVKYFKDEKIALVDGHMIYTGLEDGGVAKPENSYLSSEVKLKEAQSKLFGKMLGPFGGCYCLRSTFYSKVPSNYLVDDFYLSMSTFEKGGSAINALDAKCYEKVSTKASEEYRRKKRISAGNYQNLFRFWKLANPFSKLGYAFLSHKVLRWLGPFFMIAIIVSSLMLQSSSNFFSFIVLALITWFIGIPLINKILQSFKINFGLANAISYFNFMNLALLHGFFNFLRGIKSGIWKPTER